MSDPLSFMEGLLARLHGPLSFRFIIQPLVAIVLAFRDGRRDAHERRSPFIWGLLLKVEERSYMLQSGWKSIGKVFLVAVVLDVIFQLIALPDLRLVGAIIAGLLLAVVPYLLLRGIVNRLVAWRISKQAKLKSNWDIE